MDSSNTTAGNQFGSFIGGAVLTGIIYGGFLFFYVVSTFSLSGETLAKKENRDAFLFFSILGITGATLYVAGRYFRSGRPYTGAGILFPWIFALIATIFSAITFIDNISYHRSFDKTVWQEDASKPFKMAKTLVKSRSLIGQNKQQVLAMLGAGNYSYNNEERSAIYYSTDKFNWELRLYFVYDVVKEAFLFEEGFMD